MPQNPKDAKETGEEYISDQERRLMLRDLHGDFSWAGRQLPSSVELEGETYNLRALIWELGEKEVLEAGDREMIKALIPRIEAKVREVEARLKPEGGEGPLTKKEARAFFEECAGLLRAVKELKDLLSGAGGDVEDFQKLIDMQKVADGKRWLEFVKQIKK